jgi:hypothetical protein
MTENATRVSTNAPMERQKIADYADNLMTSVRPLYGEISTTE